MKLPNPDRAVVDVAKLRDYFLSPRHENGKHKARVFASALGLTEADAEWLRERLLAAAFEQAMPVRDTRFGSLWVVDCVVETRAGSTMVRSGWIVRTGENFPRLTTCFVMSPHE